MIWSWVAAASVGLGHQHSAAIAANTRNRGDYAIGRQSSATLVFALGWWEGPANALWLKPLPACVIKVVDFSQYKTYLQKTAISCKNRCQYRNIVN